MKHAKTTLIIAAFFCIAYILLSGYLKWDRADIDPYFIPFLILLVFAVIVQLIALAGINYPTFKNRIYNLSKPKKTLLISISALLVLLLTVILVGLSSSTFSQPPAEKEIYFFIYFTLIDLLCTVNFIYLLTEPKQQKVHDKK